MLIGRPRRLGLVDQSADEMASSIGVTGRGMDRERGGRLDWLAPSVPELESRLAEKSESSSVGIENSEGIESENKVLSLSDTRGALYLSYNRRDFKLDRPSGS